MYSYSCIRLADYRPICLPNFCEGKGTTALAVQCPSMPTVCGDIAVVVYMHVVAV